MNLFLNAVSGDGVIILFDDNRQIIDKENISILLQESSLLIDIIDNFLAKNKLKYSEIQNIVVVNGPGSFTGVRTISLVVNTISYIFENVYLTPISFFDLFKNYPIIKASSKRDLFVKNDEKSIIEIISIEDFLKYINFNGIKDIFGEGILGINTINSIDYINFLKEVRLDNKKTIEAYYVKKPNIC
nr:hypothetical protein [Candidatus Gracilibacteria bacterium]